MLKFDQHKAKMLSRLSQNTRDALVITNRIRDLLQEETDDYFVAIRALEMACVGLAFVAGDDVLTRDIINKMHENMLNIVMSDGASKPDPKKG